MLPARERMNRAEFKKFSEHPHKSTLYNRSGTLLSTPSAEIKFSVVTNKKHEKRATARNTLRRRAYALFGQSGIVVSGIFYPSKTSYTLPYQTFKQSFCELLEKVKKNIPQNP
ncbi:MAG TPA: ribonuclease P protein component [Candidatus Paceibacterota bacterium]|nr:ribonuclease P protein component [Candidatus Paceibacterota bacterium]